jgi:hypothetical protein
MTTRNTTRAFSLTEHEVRYLRKQVRYLLTARGLVNWRRNPAVWMPEWPTITRARRRELDMLAKTFVRPRVKR